MENKPEAGTVAEMTVPDPDALPGYMARIEILLDLRTGGIKLRVKNANQVTAMGMLAFAMNKIGPSGEDRKPAPKVAEGKLV